MLLRGLKDENCQVLYVTCIVFVLIDIFVFTSNVWKLTIAISSNLVLLWFPLFHNQQLCCLLKKLCSILIIWTLFMRILLNIWPLNGISASKSLPLFTIIKQCWSFLTLQIHLLFMPLCLAVSITWHAKRTLFSWQMQKGNDLLLIYLFTHHLSPSKPPHLHHCTEGRFFNFLHENNAIAFLASPAKQTRAAHGDRWPPIITECLIDPGRTECTHMSFFFFLFVCV